MRRPLPLLLPLLLAALPPPVATAQQPPQWGGLEPGEHRVGFRNYPVHDHSRGYLPAEDWRGRPAVGETARPVHVRLWYPAEPEPGSTPMPFGEYVSLVAAVLGESGERRLPEEREEYVIAELFGGPLRPWHPDGPTEESRRRVLDVPTAAVRDAPFAEGSFPVVIHAGYGAVGQSVMNEYLASHGYVVAGFPSLAADPWSYHRGEGTPEWYEAVADDIGFVHGFLRQVPGADLSRVAGIGMFSAAALLFQMREMQLDAIASLEGRFPPELREVPGYGVEKVRVPILDMPSSGVERETGILDSLCYSERWAVDLRDVAHRQFYQFERIARPDSAARDVAYEAIARTTRAFLDAVLKDDPAGRTFLEQPEAHGLPENFLEIRRVVALPAAPTEAEFLLLLRERRFEEARREFDAVREREPDHRIFRERQILDVVLFLGRDWGAEATVAPLEMAVAAYPESFEARARLGAAYRATGREARARETTIEAVRLLEEAEELPREFLVNRIGYELLSAGDVASAIRVFRANVEARPGSANAHDSLSEAYEEAGEIEPARRHARRALELLDEEQGLDPDRRERLRRALTQRLDRLR